VKASTTVTVRELLDQTSGLYDFFANPRIDTAILANKLSRWSAARALGYMRGPYCTPGTCWHYSNSGYVILGQLVKRITGNSAAVEIRRRFLDPLALGRAFAQGIETQRGPVALSYHVVGPYATARQVALGDGTSISPWTSVVTAAGDAGDMAATSTDLATWARDLYGGSVLSAASLAAMLDVRHSVVVGSSFRYGLGMFQVTIDGHRTVGHDGRLDGSRASIRYVPDSGFTIAVATNQDRVGPDVFGASLLAIAMGPPPPPRAWLAPSPSPAVASPSPPGASPSGAVVPSSSDVPASPEDSAAPSDPPSDSASADPSGP